MPGVLLSVFDCSLDVGVFVCGCAGMFGATWSEEEPEEPPCCVLFNGGSCDGADLALSGAACRHCPGIKVCGSKEPYGAKALLPCLHLLHDQ